jgi:Xaa-Pro aminopeptidase
MGFPSTLLLAGVPSMNNTLFYKIRFPAGDPAAWIQIVEPDGEPKTTLIIRDIEMRRASMTAQVDEIFCPADLVPPERISGDRDIATAQAIGEFLARSGVTRVTSDRSLPFVVVSELLNRGIQPVMDPQMGIMERRAKDDFDIECLRLAQSVTEEAMALACRMIAGARADRQGRLNIDGAPLTSERVRAAINHFLVDKGFEPCHSIVAGGQQGADCHHPGNGPLYTGEPVIVDIFPRDADTRFYGDCTRTVVHGAVSEHLGRMHAAVVAAKRAAEKALTAGATGESVHQAAIDAIHQHGFESGFQRDSADAQRCAMVHGTGHGVGLDVHEPPLLDFNGPSLLQGDAVTIEPGLYQSGIGGVRVEDLLIVTSSSPLNLNRLPEELNWIE